MKLEEKKFTNNYHKVITVLSRKILNKEMFKSFSTWSLLASNLLIAFFVIIENQNVLNVLWIYWFQSVIIGLFNFFKILTLKKFTTDGMKMNNKPLTNSKTAKVGVATFFLFHYGFFHFVYAIFLSAFISIGEISKGGIDISFILLTSLIFFINYLVEFIFNYRRELSTLQSLPKLMMSPYKRIIPMHLTIILSGFVMVGGAFSSANPNVVILIIFLGLKTFIDLITHS